MARGDAAAKGPRGRCSHQMCVCVCIYIYICITITVTVTITTNGLLLLIVIIRSAIVFIAQQSIV